MASSSMIDEKENLVLERMLSKKILPEKELFEITEYQLSEYVAEYGNAFGKGNNKLKASNYRYARRLAGRSLIKMNLTRGARFNDIKSGMVYLIENPAFAEHYKIGMTLDVHDRLSAYQTYDPYRQFSLVKYEFVLDKKLTEQRLLGHPDSCRELGEWVKRDRAIELFEKICAFEAARIKFRDKRLSIINTV